MQKLPFRFVALSFVLASGASANIRRVDAFEDVLSRRVQLDLPSESRLILAERRTLLATVTKLVAIAQKMRGANIITEAEHKEFEILCRIAEKSISTYPADSREEMAVAGKVQLSYIVGLAEKYSERIPKEKE